MTRFFVDELSENGVLLGKEDSHHLIKVMRAQPGQQFTVLCGGMAYECELIGLEGGRAAGRIHSAAQAAGEPTVRITLLQGLAKGDKMETIIQHGTEVGISEFVPVATGRTIVKLDAPRAAEKVERWQRIAREAAEQCRRGAVPHVARVISWREAVSRCREFDLALVPWEEGGEPLREVLEIDGGARTVAIFIGPEGGLSPEEVALAQEYGARVVTLGPRILRTETAGLAAAVAVLYALGDLG